MKIKFEDLVKKIRPYCKIRVYKDYSIKYGSNVLGMYYENTKTIYVYSSKHNTEENLISILLHEFAHFLTKNEFKLLSQVGYYFSIGNFYPAYEVVAESVEGICSRKIKNNGIKGSYQKIICEKLYKSLKKEHSKIIKATVDIIMEIIEG